jgi:uncharacterized protein
MKKIWPLILLVLTAASAQTPQPQVYDAELARQLGADEHGMKMYVLALLKTGPRTDLPKLDVDKAFAGHMANINRLAAMGQLAFAGPLGKNDRYRGLFIFNVSKTADAETLIATDPAIQAGLLAAETYPFYGSAALQQVNSLHNRISRD